GITIIICFCYLFYTSFYGACVLITIMVLLILYYVKRNKAIKEGRKRVRVLNERHFRIVADLLLGFKELKMSTTRNDNLYHGFLEKNRIAAREQEVESAMKFLDNTLAGRYSWYVVIGLIVFALPHVTGMGGAHVVSFLLAMLFLMGPVNTIMSL